MTRRIRVAFFASDKPREQELAKAFVAGAARHGCRTEVLPLGEPLPDLRRLDAVAMVGVKSKRLFDAVREAGSVPVMLDKGYVRARRPGSRVWEFWRVAVGGHHPTSTMMRTKMPSDRFEALGIDVAPWRRRGAQIVIAGSSAKYHAFYGLPDPNDYYVDLVANLRTRSDRPITYRPKPSYHDALPIEGTTFSGEDETIRDALWGAHVLVTHGSNACFEAVVAGVPCIILGDGVAAPISSRDLGLVDDPPLGKREQWLANLAYCQYTEREFAQGIGWEFIQRHLAPDER